MFCSPLTIFELILLIYCNTNRLAYVHSSSHLGDKTLEKNGGTVYADVHLVLLDTPI